MKKIVLQKYIAETGFCSRREAEKFIREGKVQVNGKKAELGARVDDNDEVEIKGKIVKAQEEKIYIIMNKPAGVTCTSRKFKGEKNVFSILPKALKNKYKLHVVGRLDKNSRGLVLLTNDGELTERLTHPRHEHEKHYEVKLRISNDECRRSKDKIINAMTRRVDIGEGDGVVKAKRAVFFNNKFKIVLTEGKKQQIRRMFRDVGFEVEDLVRTGIGELKLGDLKEGKFKQISKKDII